MPACAKYYHIIELKVASCANKSRIIRNTKSQYAQIYKNKKLYTRLYNLMQYCHISNIILRHSVIFIYFCNQAQIKSVLHHTMGTHAQIKYRSNRKLILRKNNMKQDKYITSLLCYIAQIVLRCLLIGAVLCKNVHDHTIISLILRKCDHSSFEAALYCIKRGYILVLY